MNPETANHNSGISDPIGQIGFTIIGQELQQEVEDREESERIEREKNLGDPPQAIEDPEETKQIEKEKDPDH
jgi:hypothetical protein